MVKLLEEIIELHTKSTVLHRYEYIYLKLLLVILTLASRAVNLHVILAFIVVNSVLLIYVGAGALLALAFISWCFLTSIIISLNILFSTFKTGIVVNLIYGFASFTSLFLFYSTTPPGHIRKLLGFNVISLTYLYLGYSMRILLDALNALKARGLSPSFKLLDYKYLLRSFTVLLITRIMETEVALKARGVE